MNIKFGTPMLEEEAKKKFCPFTMNVNDTNIDFDHRCFGSKCMAWLFVYNIPGKMIDTETANKLMDYYGEDVGFCCK